MPRKAKVVEQVEQSGSEDEKLVKVIKKSTKKVEKKVKTAKVVKVCRCCGEEVAKSNVPLVCGKCKFDDKMTLSFSNVKKQYLLTDEELETLPFFSFMVYVRGRHGSKFLVSEIEEYVDKKIKSGDVTYIKKVAKRKSFDDDKKLKAERKSLIQDFISNNIENDEDFEIQELMEKFINSKLLMLDDVKDDIIKRDNELINFANTKQVCQNNFTEIILEKFNDNIYLAELLNRTPYGAELLIGVNEFDDILKDKVSDFFSYFLGENYNVSIVTKADILKSNYIEEFGKNVSESLVNFLDSLVRRDELETKLEEKGLELRDDSKLCQGYINYGMEKIIDPDSNILTIDDIVDVVEEMDFYYKHTNYSNKMSELVRKQRYERVNYGWSDSDDSDDSDYGIGHRRAAINYNTISKSAKHAVLKKMHAHQVEDAPKRVVELWKACKNAHGK